MPLLFVKVDNMAAKEYTLEKYLFKTCVEDVCFECKALKRRR